MNSESEALSLNKITRIGGVLYLRMAPFTDFSLCVKNLVHGDALATVTNDIKVANLCAVGITIWIISQTIFILLAFTLYRLLKNVSKISALLWH